MPRERVSGIGGLFIRARDPGALASWYREQLGIPVPDGATYAGFAARPDGTDASGAPLETVWSVFPHNTTYLGATGAQWMANYRVPNLHAMLAQLRAAGVDVDEKTDESEFGRFGWATDPEGNRFELWQPPGTPTPRQDEE
ncbi:MAG: Glyoxalase-like domain protein [Gemmatimonadetes bacterium]|jgi:predicted enzyme related to lactoylglutathione lyase|nr:Glyoxalase-like domain protein [Gemmatimonadota bacterium]